MVKIKKFISEYYHYLILGLLFLLQVIIAWNIDLFGDDYYYANFFKEGFQYFIDENIFHYTMTNGRCWVHLLDELLLFNGSIVPWRIVQPFIISLTIVFSAKLATIKNKEKYKMALVLSALSFTTIDILTSNQSINWATGSMNYLLPAMLSICLGYFLYRSYLNDKLPVYVIIIAVFACGSTEQSAFASVVFVIVYFVANILKNKKLNVKDTVLVLLSILAVLALFWAPGNAVREGYYEEFYKMGIFDRIFGNFLKLVNLLFSQSGIGNILIVFFLACICYLLGKNRNIIKLIASLVSLTGAVCLFISMYVQLSQALIIVSFVCFVSVSAYMIVYWIKSEKEIAAPVILSLAILMQGAMLLSPIFGGRTTLVSGLFLIVIIVKMLSDTEFSSSAVAIVILIAAVSMNKWYIALVAVASIVILALFRNKIDKQTIMVLAIVSAIIILRNQLIVLHGYAENHAVIVENQKLVESYKENKDTDYLEQHYLRNGEYKWTMPYESSYHEWWYKKLNGIDENVPIKYTTME